MKNTLILSILLFTFFLHAGEWQSTIKRDSFAAAKNNSEYIRFEVFSTKVGIFTTRVPGYVLAGEASAELDRDQVSAMKLRIKAASLDTDGEDRDEKLHHFCLEATKYPEIIVNIDGPLALGKDALMPAAMEIRGKKKTIKVQLQVEKVGEELLASGEAKLSVSGLEIPDPSIAVAKLEDKINIFFKLKLTSK